MSRLARLVLVWLLLLTPLAWASEALTLGIFAFRPKSVMQASYQPLVDYLSAQLQRPVRVLFLTQAELEDALAHNQLDLLFTNPSHYLTLRARNNLTGALATALRNEDGVPTHSLGGVIITRAERKDIETLADIEGKTIAIPGTKFLGGYQAQLYELHEAGIHVPEAAKRAYGDHDQVIAAVLAGQADVGFVRSGVIESLVREGRLDPKRLKVINRQNLAGFPYVVSTRLYPEWPFIALPHVDERVMRRLVLALLALEADHPAARAAGLAGFVPPADYQPVEVLARTLRLPPYDAVPQFGWRDLWHKYAPWIVALALLILLLAAAVAWLIRLNHRLEQAGAALAEAEARYRLVVDNSPSIIYRLDAEGRFHFVSPSWTTLLGHPVEEVVGRDFRPFVLPEDVLICEIALRRALETQQPQQGIEYRVIHRDGSIRWHSSNILPVYDGEGRLIAVFGNAVDITQRRQAEEHLRIAASVFTHSGEGIVITDAHGDIVDVNDAFIRITGYGRDEVIGRNPKLLKSGRQGPEFYAAMWQALLQEGHWCGEVWNRRKNGEVYAEMLDISAVRNQAGQTTHYVAIFSDITLLKEQQRRLEHIAHYDALTGLPNRVLLADRLQQAMAQANRRGKSLAVAYLDLDGFKEVNDRHGHEVGDQLLIMVSNRMRQVLREVDTLARLGGDEFVAVLLDTEGDCTPLLRRLLTAAAEPVLINGTTLQVSASIGVTFYPQAEAADPDQLLRQADQAMYQAKLAGKNRVHLFSPEADRAVRGHYESVERIREALRNREFELYYQPKVNLRQGKVMGAEALIRWRHPEHGLLLPGSFLPVIDDNPLCVEIGEWVIDSALTQMARWHEQGLDLKVSVNIGAYHLLQPDFMPRLRALLSRHPEIHPGCLELEILETSALEDIAQVSEVMREADDLGVRFALDDFGTGYSSLTYLRRLPARRLKVDQTFVRGMLDDHEDLLLLEGVLGLAKAFDYEVVAEGVEEVAQGELLLLLGCEEAQGYAIAPPMPAADLPAWAASWQPASRWLGRGPVSRDRIPYLFASIEHRAWVRAIDACLKGERTAPPPMDVHQCRFGKWLDSHGQKWQPNDPAYLSLQAQHFRIHDLAHTLLALRAQGKLAEAQDRLPELFALCDQLVAQLMALAEQA